MTRPTVKSRSGGVVPSFATLQDAKRSMLSIIPREYARVESTQDALAAAVPPAKGVTLRMTIIWDNEVANLDLESVLSHMRETGAAFVLSVEQVED